MRKDKWEKSYKRKENFVFYPHEEVIRFVAKNIRRRIGLNEYEDIRSYDHTPRFLALGCGIGRHVIFAHEMNFEGYGIDLSREAVTFARDWGRKRGLTTPEEQIVQGSVDDLPWKDEFFDVIVSHGVLDSMPFETACEAVKEAHRVLRSDGLFYCDLISGDDSDHAREYSGEEVVDSDFEKETIQSYFNYCKIKKMIKSIFEIKKSLLVRREDVRRGFYGARYHLILKKMSKNDG